MDNYNVVSYLLKARTVKPAETAVAREQHGNNISPGVFYAVGAAFPQYVRNNRGPVGSGVWS
jgi:hypothetical protein